jgi:hypothetical protein
MKLTKNALMGIGAVALAAALVNLFAPQSVHGAVAALVQVSNPATNPALTSRIDDPGRIPYQKNFSCQLPVGNGCTVVTGPVPANHRLVVEFVSGNVSFSGLASFSQVNLMTAGGDLAAFFTPVASFCCGSNGTEFNQPVRVYVDQNQSLSVRIVADVNVNITYGELMVSGYLLDCNAGPCATVASF